MKFLIGAALLALSASGAAADPTAGEVHSWCMGKDKQRCFTYISALREGYVIGDATVFVNGKLVERKRSVCVPDSDQLPDGQLVAKVFTAMTLDFGGFPEA
jgi:hypothetical protein